MHKLLTGVAVLAFAAVQATSPAPASAAKACSASNPPVLINMKTKTYTVYPAATSEKQRQKNIAAAQKAMAADPNVMGGCKSDAIKMGAHLQNGFGGINAIPSPTPGKGPPSHTP